MAADLQPEWICGLPSSWSYGLTRDGRVFFVNEEAKSTTWLHPLNGEAVVTGHRKTPDLPTGWEEGYTFEGARCFIKRMQNQASASMLRTTNHCVQASLTPEGDVQTAGCPAGPGRSCSHAAAISWKVCAPKI
ncbi:pleckstrin homology domain-containing family A member 5 isoform X13 [Corythoichthys intestinalis]|uniref:pleckstrin homology domain-containing family A member 5 isoform X13 n=1 Tax=Corythoichthys intestinalis TaxID=161448 RepID=UPI0025A5115A|nr:pleckstrin homology domain-containing family A member 5-like isoform X13 [Corythoichthys intestinalis]